MHCELSLMHDGMQSINLPLNMPLYISDPFPPLSRVHSPCKGKAHFTQKQQIENTFYFTLGTTIQGMQCWAACRPMQHTAPLTRSRNGVSQRGARQDSTHPRHARQVATALAPLHAGRRVGAGGASLPALLGARWAGLITSRRRSLCPRSILFFSPVALANDSGLHGGWTQHAMQLDKQA
jgi:hypothetical protein